MKFWMISLSIGFIIWGLSMLVSTLAGMGLPGPIVGVWLIVTGILILVNR